jgi:hypothetical protein
MTATLLQAGSIKPPWAFASKGAGSLCGERLVLGTDDSTVISWLQSLDKGTV